MADSVSIKLEDRERVASGKLKQVIAKIAQDMIETGLVKLAAVLQIEMLEHAQFGNVETAIGKNGQGEDSGNSLRAVRGIVAHGTVLRRVCGKDGLSG